MGTAIYLKVLAISTVFGAKKAPLSHEISESLD